MVKVKGKKCTSFLEVKDNELLWTKHDSQITVLNFFKKPFACEACGKETQMTSQSTNLGLGPHHPVCTECYPELHAHHKIIEKEILEDGRGTGVRKE